MNIFQMKTSKFMKLLRHAGILHGTNAKQEDQYIHLEDQNAHSYGNNSNLYGEIELTDDSDELDQVKKRLAYSSKPVLRSFNNDSMKVWPNIQTDLQDCEDVNINKPWTEFQSRIRMSEYNNASLSDIDINTDNSLTAKTLKQIEVDLLLQYLITPAISEDPNAHNTLEVVSVQNHSRQFLVNLEEQKDQYRFGNSKRRSWFLPQESNGGETFYIDTAQKEIRKHSGKLDYDAFIKALELISRKVYPAVDHGTAFIELLKSKIFPLYRSEIISEKQEKESNYEQKLAQAFEILDNEYVIDILSVVYKQLVPFFKSYCKQGSAKMNEQRFLDFMRDFALYPSIASKEELRKIFKYLANILKRADGDFDPWRLILHDNQDPLSNGPEEMDSHMFIESIAMTAIIHIQVDPQANFKWCFNQKIDSQNEYVQKILTLCERISSSLQNPTITKTY
jgi:hypothetical protein